MNKSNDRTLSFFFIGSAISGDFAFSPEKADFILNSIVLDQMVGTLVKERHGNTGNSEPYLAESWESTPDQLVWEFNLRSGLTAQDGTPINAETFAASLTTLLAQAAKQHDVPAFNRLKGWKEFTANKTKSISGIQVNGPLKLKLQFLATPSGLLQYLAMPGFGFFSPKDFINGEWRNEKSIFSTGPYQLDAVNDDRSVIISKRVFLQENEEAPTRVKFSFATPAEIVQKPATHTIGLLRGDAGSMAVPPGFSKVAGFPMITTALVLSPYIQRVFHRTENRKLFARKIRAKLAGRKAVSPGAFFGADLFPVDSPLSQGLEPTGNAAIRYDGSDPIKILVGRGVPTPDKSVILGAVTETLAEDGVPFEVVQDDPSQKDWIEKTHSNRHYDIRFASVDVGGNVERWVLKMMFCSKLGISFPDASGRVCSLVENESIGDDRIGGELARILREEEEVVPLYHYGLNWIFSNDIDTSEITTTLNLPRAELLKLK